MRVLETRTRSWFPGRYLLVRHLPDLARGRAIARWKGIEDRGTFPQCADGQKAKNKSVAAHQRRAKTPRSAGAKASIWLKTRAWLEVSQRAMTFGMVPIISAAHQLLEASATSLSAPFSSRRFLLIAKCWSEHAQPKKIEFPGPLVGPRGWTRLPT